MELSIPDQKRMDQIDMTNGKQSGITMVTIPLEEYKALKGALQYPRFGDTAGLLGKIADNLDRDTEAVWTHLYSKHLRLAAEGIRTALAVIAKHDAAYSAQQHER